MKIVKTEAVMAIFGERCWHGNMQSNIEVIAQS